MVQPEVVELEWVQAPDGRAVPQEPAVREVVVKLSLLWCITSPPW